MHMIVKDGLSCLCTVVLKDIHMLYSEDIFVYMSDAFWYSCKVRERVFGDFKNIFVMLIWDYEQMPRTRREIIKECCDEIIAIDSPSWSFSWDYLAKNTHSFRVRKIEIYIHIISIFIYTTNKIYLLSILRFHLSFRGDLKEVSCKKRGL